MNKTITVYSTEHEVQDWREADRYAGANPLANQMQALMADESELKPGEVSFASKSMFRLHTNFGLKGEKDNFQIVSSENGRYRARTV